MYDFVASPLALLIGYDRYQGWFSNNDAGGAYTRFTKCSVDTSQVFLTCHAVDGPPSRTNIAAIHGSPLPWMVPPLAWYSASV